MPAPKTSDLSALRGLILDMDGVLWEGESPLPGMPEFFRFLREREIRFVLATNNASLTVESYIQKLARMDVTAAPEEILTSATATAEYLKSVCRPGERAYIIGEEGLIRAVESAGVQAAAPDALDAHYVICGMDRNLNWNKLANATINLHRGARFIGTNGDITFPTERGIAHGNGAILAALTAASGIRPKIIGKPYPAIMQMAVARLDMPKARIAAVGDRLETDILGAKNAGLKSILILTGVTSRKDLRKNGVRPTWVIDDLPALQAVWTARGRPSGG
ncbi:MAG: HAD-IIA family hydrolase [Anaerolineales bacterium]